MLDAASIVCCVHLETPPDRGLRVDSTIPPKVVYIMDPHLSQTLGACAILLRNHCSILSPFPYQNIKTYIEKSPAYNRPAKIYTYNKCVRIILLKASPLVESPAATDDSAQTYLRRP